MDISTNDGSTLLTGFDADGYTSTEDPRSYDSTGYTSTEDRHTEDRLRQTTGYTSTEDHLGQSVGYTSTEDQLASSRQSMNDSSTTTHLPAVNPMDGDCAHASTEEMKVESQSTGQDGNLDTQMVLPHPHSLLLPTDPISVFVVCVAYFISLHSASWGKALDNCARACSVKYAVWYLLFTPPPFAPLLGAIESSSIGSGPDCEDTAHRCTSLEQLLTPLPDTQRPFLCRTPNTHSQLEKRTKRNVGRAARRLARLGGAPKQVHTFWIDRPISLVLLRLDHDTICCHRRKPVVHALMCCLTRRARDKGNVDTSRR
jgi:hypothetical protein